MDAVPSFDRYEKMRIKGGFSNSEVARLSGVPKSTFSDWKSGKSKPKLPKLTKIATALGCSPGDLMEGDAIVEYKVGDSYVAVQSLEPEREAQIKRLLAYATLLDPANLATAANVVGAMLDSQRSLNKSLEENWRSLEKALKEGDPDEEP